MCSISEEHMVINTNDISVHYECIDSSIGNSEVNKEEFKDLQ